MPRTKKESPSAKVVARRSSQTPARRGRTNEETRDGSLGVGPGLTSDGMEFWAAETNPANELDALAKAKAKALAALGNLAGPAEHSPTHPPPSRGKRPRGRVPPSASRTQVDGRESRSSKHALSADSSSGKERNDDVDYIAAELTVPDELGEFAAVLSRFAAAGHGSVEDVEAEANADEIGLDATLPRENGDGIEAGGDDELDSDENGLQSASAKKKDVRASDVDLSERQLRRRNRLSIAQLKALVRDPGVVEQWDVTAEDPLLLVHLKALCGSVPVPANWRQKRKYLQSKRGMEKTLFKMPAFIEDTGVGAARTAAAEADAAKTAKQKARERIRPKASGKGVDVDYSVLRDAFFKFQTKPRLTGHGDLYYELREREVKHENFRPGVLSASLREALGVGAHDPPPWLVAMQRYGPPPSYPGLEIQGLNAPIPVGASFGYHAGGWGKPPVDQYGRPLYGDVFGEGTKYNEADSRFELSATDKEKMWGEVRPPGEFDVDEDEEAAAEMARKRHNYHDGTEVENDEVEVDKESRGEKNSVSKDVEAAKAAASVPGAAAAGAANLPGVMSVPAGLETPAQGIELRKGLAPGQLFTVLEQKNIAVGKDGLMGSSHVYDVGTGAERANDSMSSTGTPGPGDVTGENLLKKRKASGEDKDEGREAKKVKDGKETAKAKENEFKF